MKIKTLSYAAVAGAIAIAASALTVPALAHGPGPGGYGQGYYGHMGEHGYGQMGGQGMMSHGYGQMGGQGMMGHGYGQMGGQGMMGHGYGQMGGQGMMGSGMHGDCSGARGDLNLEIEDVTKFVEGMLVMHKDDGLRLGKVEAAGETSIVAEIVDADGKAVHKIEFDRKTGAHHPIR